MTPPRGPERTLRDREPMDFDSPKLANRLWVSADPYEATAVELTVNAWTDGFAGTSSAYVDKDELEAFGDALTAYPLG